MRNKVAFLTTIFPMKVEFLYTFFDSLREQSYKKFDIIVVNDMYENFNDLKEKYSDLNIIELYYSNSIAKNREYGINYVINQGYEVLIFGDSDDYFSSNRVEHSLDYLNTYDIVVNDLSLFDEEHVFCHRYISNRIQNNTKIEFTFIEDKNIFGLSNTAINVHILSEVNFPTDLVAVDWYLFKGLLLLNYQAIFTNEIETYYRQYENNTLGLNVKNGFYPLWWEEKKI